VNLLSVKKDMRICKVKNLLLYLLVTSLPFYGFSVINLGERGVPFHWIFASSLILFFFLDTLLLRKKIKINWIGLIVLFFASSAILSLIGIFTESKNRLVSYFTLFSQYLLCILTFFTISNLRVSVKYIENLFKTWVFVAFIVGLYGVYQGLARIFHLPFSSVILTNPSYSPYQRFGGYGANPFLRVTSIFGEPSWYGAYLVPPIFVLLVALLFKQDKNILFKHQFVNYFLLIFLLFALIQAGSIGAYATFLGVGFIMLLRERLLYRIKFIKVSFIVLFGVSLVNLLLEIYGISVVSFAFRKIMKLIRAPFSIIFSQKIIYVADLVYRLEVISSIFSTWAKQPLIYQIFGAGLNSLETHPIQVRSRLVTATASAYTQVLMDQGILGLIILLVLVISILRKLAVVQKILLKKQKTMNENKIAILITLLSISYYVIWCDAINMLARSLDFARWFNFSLATLIIFKTKEFIKKR